MTTPIPRRVKDLLVFGIDSEDDFNTPCKPKPSTVTKPPASKLEACENANKENVSQQKNTQNTSSHNEKKDFSYRLLPKRPSELTMLESDSEEEDSKSNHNLNCAILNDSFILSPMHEPYDSTPSVSDNAAAPKRTDSNLSFLGRFGNMAIDCSNSHQSPSSEVKQPPPKKLPPSTLHTISEQRKAVDIETPLRFAPLASSKSSNVNSDTDFVTPQVRAISTTHGTRRHNVGSTQAQKSRHAMANEFRSQKVLFQTPMTVSRGAPFPSDSLTFSLCDTISESPDTPAQPAPSVVVTSIKSKKSLESAFRETEKKADAVAHEAITTLPAPVPMPAQSSAKAAPLQATNSTNTSNALRIKNHEYVICKKLGCGGSSSVYLTRRQDTGEEFALKVVDLQADPSVVEGYLNETKLLEKLQGNICVVALYDYELLRKESKLYMVMEKGDSDLNKILQSYTTNLPLYNLMNILYQMFQAVNYIHQNGVIHSDLKPANFLMVNGRLKLIDFGIASNIAVESTSIIKFSQAGTFNYISPEALTDISTGSSPMRNDQPKIKISTKSDVWSLGCILYLLLYQKTPFGHIRNIHAKMSAIASPKTSIEYPAMPVYYPNMLVHMAKNCLQHNPKKRPSCVELLQYPFHMVIPIQNLALAASKR